jgi:hypothetical protein
MISELKTTARSAVIVSKESYLEIERALHDSINKHQESLSLAEIMMSEVLDKLSPEQIEQVKKAIAGLYASAELIHFVQLKLSECVKSP